MATTTNMSSVTDRRSEVLVGELPQDFLRVPANPQQQQIAADQQTAAMLQHVQAQQPGFSFVAPSVANVPRLSVAITQAKLTKNYGLTKMDPYCRLRVGHSVFETHTAHSGGKNPRWNKSIHCYIPTGVDAVYIEIFDERAFTMDDRVAWAHVSIPQVVFSGETSDEWYTLTGKQGNDKEGMINLVFSQSTAPAPVAQPIVYTTGGMAPPVMVMPGAAPAYYPVAPPGSVAVQQPYPPQQLPPQQQQQPQPVVITEEDIKQVKELFPNIDDEVVRSVLESNRGDKDRCINDLLIMSTESNQS